MPKVCGTDGIRSFLSEGYKYGLRNVVLTTEEVMRGKEAVIETGKYEVFIGNNVSVEKGKFVVVWKEENGKWKRFGISGIQTPRHHHRQQLLQNNNSFILYNRSANGGTVFIWLYF